MDEVNRDLVALTYGPIVLVSEDMTYLVGNREHPETWIKPVAGEDMAFLTEPGHTGVYDFVRRKFVPYYTYPEDKWYFMYNRIFPEGHEFPRKK